MNDGNPQIEDGYTRIANELYDAILRYDFTKIEFKIIFAVIRKTYGYQKKMDIISTRQLSRATNCSRRWITKSVNELITRDIIFERTNGQKRSLGLNKKFTEWLPPTGVMVTPVSMKKKKDINITGVTLTPVRKIKPVSPRHRLIETTISNRCHLDTTTGVTPTPEPVSPRHRNRCQGDTTIKKERKKESFKESHRNEKSVSVTSDLKKADQYSSSDFETAEYFFSLIEKMNPGHKIPNLKTWAKNIRLHRERDGRTIAEIRELFKWANSDDFWQSNILSPDKLRKKWDQLVIQKNRSNRITQKPEFKTVSEKYLDELRECGEAIDRRARESQP